MAKGQDLLTLGLASIVVSAFVAGITTYVFLQGMIESAVGPVRARAELAQRRISGIELQFGGQEEGPGFACGGTDVKNDPYVMTGSRDGTGCGIQNQNYYRRITLRKPPESRLPASTERFWIIDVTFVSGRPNALLGG